MGNTFISKAEAARLLGVSIRTIYRHLQQGKVRPITKGRVVGVCREDVAKLIGSKDSVSPFVATKSFLAQLLARVTELEQRTTILERLLNIKHDELKLSDTELLTLFRASKKYASSKWPAPVEETWGGVFLRLKSDHLERLEALTAEKHPWTVFYRLAINMRDRPFDKSLKDLFTAGANNLRDLAVVWCVLKGESASGTEMLLRDVVGTAKEDISKAAAKPETQSEL